MPRDAKLGFVVGVALVIVIAVIFYHGSGTAGAPGNLRTPPDPTGKDADSEPGDARRSQAAHLSPGPVPGPAQAAASPKMRSHTVKEGETLSSLAIMYYGDASQSSLLFRANRSQLIAPDRLVAGTVLLIPDLPDRE
jgi:nucleoid-associated protein YgaU